MLGKRFKERSSVLRTLFRLIDVGSDQLNLTLAQLILAVCRQPECRVAEPPFGGIQDLKFEKFNFFLCVISARRQRKQPAEHLQTHI